MPQALENNEIDAFSAWEPTPTLAIKNFPSLKVPQ
jgi:ABC-type nitrate/sulfonate/bicarbonate transport system substrate-binding protein